MPMTYDLAPHNPYGFSIASPLIARAGRSGAGLDKLATWPQIGAVLSDPISVREWKGALPQAIPGGLIWHTNTRSLKRLHKEFRRWHGRPILPVLLPFDRNEAAQLLEPCLDAELRGIVIDITEQTDINETKRCLQYLRDHWQAPIFVECATDTPFEHLKAELSNCDGIMITRGPQATVGNEHIGRVIGPAIEPIVLATIVKIQSSNPTNIIPEIHTKRGLGILLEMGIHTVILNTTLWNAPEVVAELHTFLQSTT